MKWFKTFLAATVLSAAMLFPGAAQAMEIRQFDEMAIQDQGAYVQALVDGAQKVLIDQGRRDLAAKVYQLFTEVPRGDNRSLGMTEFESNLQRARLTDAQEVAKDSKALRIEVEDAMAVTLQANHIELPDIFFTVAKNFKPRYPPQR
jgi:hypothetical protein